MKLRISDRMSKPDFQGDFTARILAAAGDPSIISFAGGLPNPDSFPVKEMEAAVTKVLERDGVRALQYSNTEGYMPLRQFISDRYAKQGLDYAPTNIIITNGSQQALDMVSACLIDPDDEIVVEKPSYLAALQTFHLYYPKVLSVSLNEDGIDCGELEKTLSEHDPKFIYVIPSFQNPTGLTYTQAVRERAAEILKKSGIPVIEDNPYGELRFRGDGNVKTFAELLGEQVCELGTFSKIVAPGMRIGWIACKNPELYAKLVAYKSTMDLHTNIFGQMVLAEYLLDNDLDGQIEKIKKMYGDKAEKMMDCMSKDFPEGVTFTKPEGGMFIWATLPEGLTAVDVMEYAAKRGVAVCPGDPFYEEDRNVRTMRINYSNSSDENIEKGIKILGDTLRELMSK